MINSVDDNEKKDFKEKDNNLDTKKKRVSYRAKANEFEKKKILQKLNQPLIKVNLKLII